MKASFNIAQRKPVWIALSEFYLDTVPDDAALRQIAFTIIESPFTFEEIKHINKYEVFPILQHNLLSTTGVWFRFDEERLVERITSRLNSKNIFKDFGLEISYLAFKWMCRKYWQRLEIIYNEIKENPDSYIVTCRNAFMADVLPFQFIKRGHPLYRKLYQIALGYKDRDQLQEFYQFLQEGQYNINIWTAFFVLEVLEVDRMVKLVGISDKVSVFDYSYRLIENTFQGFKDKNQVRNCSYWLEEKRREKQV